MLNYTCKHCKSILSTIVIIGNGISGTTAARHIRKMSDHEIIMISSEHKYFFSRTALMYVYMGHMKFEHLHPYESWFWKKNKINLIQDKVESIDVESKSIVLTNQGALAYDKLILALGSHPRFLNIPGEELNGVQSLYSKQDLELMEENTQQIKTAVVIGGGLIGIEMAEMLHSRGIEVTMIIRESNFWNMVLPEEEATIVSEHIISRGINLIYNRQVKEIKGGGAVESILLDNGEVITTQFVGVTVGVEPNKELAEQAGLKTNRGVVVNASLQTSSNDIYAIGDCAEVIQPEIGRRSVEPIWYTGRMMGETVAESICDSPQDYHPGIWFNSAKFFDLEYQTYGQVPLADSESSNSLFFSFTEDRCLRLVMNSSDKIIGFNALGIRLRHEVCNQWIEQEKSMDYVIENISKLDFDPEFYQRVLEQVKADYK